MIERISTSTLSADRRDACRNLKALSRENRVLVGAHGMSVLIDVLRDEGCDSETQGYALESLYNIMCTEPFDDAEYEVVDHDSAEIGEQFCEIFTKSPDNITIILRVLEEYNFKTRWPAVKLLSVLIKSRTKDIQSIILTSPMAFSKLMDLLNDTREVIRNEAIVFLKCLVKGNLNIQKIMAFENGFERLFEIIQIEGGLFGGVVVEDSLTLILNLLKNNASNQQFFKESSHIPRLTPLMNLDEIEETSWTPQFISNAYLVLQIIRSLIATNNIQVNLTSAQCAMRNCALLETMCNILMKNGVPVRILSETINTVSEIIRGNKSNQDILQKLMAPCTPPQSAILILLMSMVNEKQVFELRCAILYCFQSFMFQNTTGQESIIQTLVPSGDHGTALTIGQLLCGGIISNEPLTCWLSANALMHVIMHGKQPKEQLLRVLLAKSDNNLSISLLEKCATLVQTRKDIQSKVGLLMMLCTWLSESKKSVKAFMSVPDILEYLVSQTIGNQDNEDEVLFQGLCAFLLGNCLQYSDNVSDDNSRGDLYQSIEKRIGLEAFTMKIGEISRHSHYSIASKMPTISLVDPPSKLLLDFSFCRLFKNTEATITNSLSNSNPKSVQNESISDARVLQQYKDIIRAQDEKLNQMQHSIRQYEENQRLLQEENAALKQKNTKLVDQNILYKAQLSAKRMKSEKQDGNDAVPVNNPEPNGSNNDDLIELLLHQVLLLFRFIVASSIYSGS